MAGLLERAPAGMALPIRPARLHRPATARLSRAASARAPAASCAPRSAGLEALRASRPAAGRLGRRSVAARADALAGAQLDPMEKAASKLVGEKAAPSVVTLSFIAMWYALNIGFNLLNKTIFGYFPFPWTVSAVHVVVGLAYCTIAYVVGAKKASFGRPITKEEFGTLFMPSSMHAIGHIAANLSFAAVAISLTHTVKTLEPAFNVLLSKLLLGAGTPAPVIATLLPIMAGVALASASDLTFNWPGFISAMVSNLTFGFRAVLSKKAMGSIRNLDSTAIYAYTTLISVLICVPGALIMEGPKLRAGVDAALAKNPNFYWALFSVGLLYHLYNQFAFNTLGRLSPVSHGVCNVVKRVAIIITSVLFFGTTLTPKTKMGTGIALLGTYLYTEASRRSRLEAKVAPKPLDGGSPGGALPRPT